MSQDLAGKIALVTGGSRGIGEGIAHHLANQGATVVLTARSQDAAETVAAAIRTAGGVATGLALDLDDPSSVEDCVAGVLAAHERIDVLVNNAGITRDNLLMRMKPEDWEAVVSTNLGGHLPYVSGDRPEDGPGQVTGRIVNITSVVGTLGKPRPGQLRRHEGRGGGDFRVASPANSLLAISR